MLLSWKGVLFFVSKTRKKSCKGLLSYNSKMFRWFHGKISQIENMTLVLLLLLLLFSFFFFLCLFLFLGLNKSRVPFTFLE